MKVPFLLLLIACVASCYNARSSPYVGFVSSKTSTSFAINHDTSLPPPITSSITKISSPRRIVDSKLVQLAAKKKNKGSIQGSEEDVDDLINGSLVTTVAEENVDDHVESSTTTEDDATAAAVVDTFDSLNAVGIVSENDGSENSDEDDEEEESEEMIHDKAMMRMAINMATSSGGERGSHGPFPKAICGAVLVAKDGRVSCQPCLLTALFYLNCGKNTVCTSHVHNNSLCLPLDSRQRPIKLCRTRSRICIQRCWYISYAIT